MKRVLKIFLLVLFIVGLVFTLFYLFNKSKTKPVVYGTEKAFYTTIIQKTVATGSVVPRNEIEIKPQLSGIIDELYVEPGQLVKKGDLIARIKVIPNMGALQSAESRVQRAEIALNNAKQDYDRNVPLANDGVISAQEFQQFRFAKETAQEELNSAKENLRIVRDGVSSQKSGSNTLVRSTISGMVLDVPVEEGFSVIEANTFNAGTTIAFVADMNEMVFEGNVDESEVGKLKIGMELILTLGAVDNKSITAKLEHIAPKGKEDQGAIQFEIRAAIENPDNIFIRAGYSANADIVLERRDSVLSVPESLVSYDQGKAYVEVEKSPQVFEKQFVELGLSDGINVEILKGVDTTLALKGKELRDEAPKAKQGGRWAS
ncbi:MAG: efflux RND transporter periplasmic adaptor subunit [Flavobacteriales bacterium]|nr:efflux RND transporter periplasmic adaptor subunit [Flavobacteriales bacterium]